jgi:hypothetical protein
MVYNKFNSELQCKMQVLSMFRHSQLLNTSPDTLSLSTFAEWHCEMLL